MLPPLLTAEQRCAYAPDLPAQQALLPILPKVQPSFDADAVSVLIVYPQEDAGSLSTAPSVRGMTTLAALVDDVKQKNKDNPVIVYSKTWCPSCSQVRSPQEGEPSLHWIKSGIFEASLPAPACVGGCICPRSPYPLQGTRGE